jgi:hypothetical protein
LETRRPDIEERDDVLPFWNRKCDETSSVDRAHGACSIPTKTTTPRESCRHHIGAIANLLLLLSVVAADCYLRQSSWLRTVVIVVQ